eukprot:3935701-Rhodomonas_salina.1
MNTEVWTLDTGHWTLDTGHLRHWTLETAYCSPSLETVRSQLPETRKKDYAVYPFSMSVASDSETHSHPPVLFFSSHPLITPSFLARALPRCDLFDTLFSHAGGRDGLAAHAYQQRSRKRTEQDAERRIRSHRLQLSAGRRARKQRESTTQSRRGRGTASRGSSHVSG